MPQGLGFSFGNFSWYTPCFKSTRGYGPLRGPTSSYCRKLRPRLFCPLGQTIFFPYANWLFLGPLIGSVVTWGAPIEEKNSPNKIFMFFLVLLLKEIVLWPEFSSQTRFRIQTGYSEPDGQRTDKGHTKDGQRMNKGRTRDGQRTKDGNPCV